MEAPTESRQLATESERDPAAKSIKNLEILDYYALRLNEIFNYKELSTYFSSMERHFVNLQKWKMLRNFLVIMLWAILLLARPDWCEVTPGIRADCSAVEDQRQYFTIAGYFIDINGFEIASWCIMLVLILYDVLLVSVSARLLIAYSVLFIFDILTGFLFIDKTISVKINTLSRFAFLIMYTQTTRFMMSELLQFYWKIKKLYMLYLSMVLVLGMLLNVLYFDVTEEASDLYFNKFDFSNIITSFYTSYTVITFQSTLNLFSFTLRKNPIFILFLLPIYFLVLFLLLPFIISLMTYFYVLTVRDSIVNLENFPSFKKIFFYFKNDRGICNYLGLDQFIADFMKDPKKVDFKQFESKQNSEKIDDRKTRFAYLKKEYNTRHHKEFLQYQNHAFYKLILVCVDTFLTLSPIVIINAGEKGINNAWYITIILFATLSMINPMFSLLFNIHKISSQRKKVYGFSIIISLFMIILAIILPMQKADPGKTVEQSNDLLFVIFSFLCFTKSMTIIDELWLKNDLIYNIFLLAQQIVPFLTKTLSCVVALIIFYSFLGRMMFGGLMHSQSKLDYESFTGIKLRPNYEYFNFNDILNSFLTLTVMIIQNNWVYVTEHFFFVRQKFSTTLFFVSFNVLVSFTFISLFIGVIAKMIIAYFESDFEHIGVKKALEKNVEIISDSEEEKEDERAIG